MESGNQSSDYNKELVQKYGITDSYLARCINKKHSNHSLLTGYFDNGKVYSLYSRDGDLMVLVDAFRSLDEANQQAQAILSNYQETAEFPVSSKKK
ncbi:hypothetical protein PSI23_20690 [Xenorhabdus sp. XENO-10]|uniref:Uncharacterized protein n=1 Tax=Xenorhabdus yunnanensis TaxID=3025878 RepID=A0ABT5LPF8_9GAMM|nr:hypothetical protein [Xenorhabdus yunnanensis]MDC9591630.1 hypothetical protein [Xenorhabdus yunnanensis]